MQPLLKRRIKSDKASISFIPVTLLLVGALISFFLYEPAKKPAIPFSGSSNLVTPPEFSVSPGMYDAGIFLQFKPLQSGSQVYYTLNASLPDFNSSIFKDPIIISDRSNEENTISLISTSPRWKPPLRRVPKATIVRAISVTGDSVASEPAEATYLINVKHKLPVVSLIINEKDFFDYKEGIYVMGKGHDDKDNYMRKNIKLDYPWWEHPANYKSRGANSERPVTIQLIGFNEVPLTADAGVRISGNATRAFPQKSLRITFSKRYGDENIKTKLFEKDPINKYSSFILRNSGNDWDKTMLRDAFMQALLKDKTNIDLQESRPVIVYINGEYWGIHYLAERQDENYISSHYNIHPDSLTILENSGQLFSGSRVVTEKFQTFMKSINTGDPNSNYEKINNEIDIENFTDYIISEIYFANTDWPSNNVRFWKKNDCFSDDRAASCKWRWMISDLDWGFGYTSDEAYNLNLFETIKNSNSAVAILFEALNKNTGYRKYFLERFRFHLKNTFEPERVLKILEEKSVDIALEMETHISRWRYPSGYNIWLKNIDRVKQFARERHRVIQTQLKEIYP